MDEYPKADAEVSMKPMLSKPMLSKLIQEAFKHALIDSLPEPKGAQGLEDLDRLYQERRSKLAWDIDQVDPEEWARIAPTVLARNISVRLLGLGGWEVGGVYSGNASPREVFDATFHRADEDPNADIKMFLRSHGVETEE